MSSTEQPEWQQYFATHHGHVGLAADTTKGGEIVWPLPIGRAISK